MSAGGYLDKIVDLDRMAEIREAARRQGKRCVLAHGIFDIIHPGHTRHLEWARRQGDLLLVTVADDGHALKTRTPVDIRQENLCALSMVDHVARVASLDATESVERIRPDVLVRGMEFHGVHADIAAREKAAVEAHGGELLLSSGDPAYTNIRTAELEGSYLKSRETVLHQLLERQGIAPRRLEEIAGGFRDLRVLVVGDAIVEEYVHSDALGMAIEDPVIVVKPRRTERFLGGAAGVAEHAAALGAGVEAITVVGSDHTAGFLARRAESSRARYHLLSDETRPTTLKQRFLGGRKKLLRANYFEEHPVRDRIAGRIVELAAAAIPRVDLVLLWDGSYGVLPERVREEILGRAREARVPVAGMAPCSTQIASVDRYRGLDVLVATEREVRMACWDTESSLVQLGSGLIERTGNRGLLVSLGDSGTLVFESAGRREYIPAFAARIADPLGATDAMFVATALGRAAGAGLFESAILGCAAHAVEAGADGNVPVEARRLRERLLEQIYPSAGVPAGSVFSAAGAAAAGGGEPTEVDRHESVAPGRRPR